MRKSVLVKKQTTENSVIHNHSFSSHPGPLPKPYVANKNKVDFEKLNNFLKTHPPGTANKNIPDENKKPIQRVKAEYSNSSPYGIASKLHLEK